MRRLTLLSLLLALAPGLAWSATIDADGNYLTQTCRSGEGRVEVFAGGGNGYGSGTVTFQFFSVASGAYENVCATAADCQWSSGDSGAVPFDVGGRASLRLNMNGSTSPTVDAEIVCN